MFSNSNEATCFLQKNCYKCINLKKCTAKRNIDLGFLTGELSKKTKSMIDFDKLICNQFNKPFSKKTKKQSKQLLFNF